MLFDGSGSMASYGYPRAKGEDAEAIFAPLILLLPQLLSAPGGTPVFHEFGKKTAAGKTEFPEVKPSQLHELARPNHYCAQARCTYQDSPVEDAFKKILDYPPDTLGVVVTDLFLSNAQFVGPAAVALQQPLTDALRQGRAIGILAVRTASTGPIYDLTAIGSNQCYSQKNGLYDCNRGAAQYEGATSRPLFLVMIGPSRRILDLKQKLDSELLNQVHPSHRQFTLFTTQPLNGFKYAAASDRAIFQGVGTGQSAGFLDAYFPKGFPGPQYLLESRQRGFTGIANLAEAWTPGVPLPESLKVAISAWRQRDRGQSCEKTWVPLAEQDAARIVSYTHKTDFLGDLSIAVPTPQGTGLRPNADAYLVALSFVALGHRPDSWFGDWGYHEYDERKVLDGRPTFFPAKNLPNLGKVLTNIVREQEQPVELGELRLGLKIR